MNLLKRAIDVLLGTTILISMFFLMGYNAYHHNFQLLFLTVVILLNTLGIGSLLQKLKR